MEAKVRKTLLFLRRPQVTCEDLDGDRAVMDSNLGRYPFVH
ncbi:hypothetical protein V6Z11_A08G155600 [Gossypium hirsutum]